MGRVRVVLAAVVAAFALPAAGLGDDEPAPNLNEIADALVEAAAAVAVDAVNEHVVGEEADEDTKRLQRDAVKTLLDPREDRSKQNWDQLTRDAREIFGDSSTPPSSPRSSRPSGSPAPRPSALTQPAPARRQPAAPRPHSHPAAAPQALTEVPRASAPPTVESPRSMAPWGVVAAPSAMSPTAPAPRPTHDLATTIAAIVMVIAAIALTAAVVVVAARRGAPARPSVSASLRAKGYPRLPISAAPFVLGRREDCHLRIEDPQVSGCHAQIVDAGGVLTLSDCDSRNGTFLNGTRVARPTKLATGDKIRLGQTEVTFRYDD